MLNKTQQIVLSVTKEWDTLHAVIIRLEKKDDNTWRETGERFQAVVGKKGLGLGHGTTFGENTAPWKKEGDKKAPAGVFPVLRAMGYAAKPPAGVEFPYEQSTVTHRCVDDPASDLYNRIIDENQLKDDPSVLYGSSEKMKRKDILYKWLLVVGYNIDGPQPGKGSCIFIHVWRSPKHGTAGCTALSEQDLIELMKWLRREKNPFLVQVPLSALKTLKNELGLPDIDVTF